MVIGFFTGIMKWRVVFHWNHEVGKVVEILDRMYNTIIREYNDNDLQEMIDIWNEVVEEGIAFPQEDCLDLISGREVFASQSYTGVAETESGILGLYDIRVKRSKSCASAMI